jgi:hypothetical protein
MARLLDAPRLDGSMRARLAARRLTALRLDARKAGCRLEPWRIAAKAGRSIAGLRFGIEAAMA